MVKGKLTRNAITRAKARWGAGWHLLSDILQDLAVVAEIAHIAYLQDTEEASGKVIKECMDDFNENGL